ncbi:VOC family protein [Dictyobacter arantiisoli]|uniref:VOC family protein n=1 Tax=Dictyobacter arantiisoli TaxID=2014874 RepID=A0A5A5T6M1_9CHLR|nr:VOC family protein [Dictyobacter arantiisoli]GCF07027.1 VOC family protein [Dictyobacter arantiisoli]
MTQLSAYLHFNGNCREAMIFYKECLGGELQLQVIGETPMADQMPSEMRDNILHSSLVKEGFSLLASDLMGEVRPIKGNTISLCLDCGSEKEINTYFANLSAGGEIEHPLKEEFWGAIYGEVTDRFGVKWLFNFDKNQQA